MASLEKIWVVGKEVLPLSGKIPPLPGVDLRYVDTPNDLLAQSSLDEKISFLSALPFQSELHSSLGKRMVAGRAYVGPRTEDLFQLHVNSLLDEIRLEHDLAIAESVAWKACSTNEIVSIDFLGKAILEIFSCRDATSIENALFLNCQALAPIEKIRLQADPPYASMQELQRYHLAVPVQQHGKLLAHIYVRFPQSLTLAEKEKSCEAVGEALIGIGDAIALALERNSLIASTAQTSIIWEASFDAIEDPVVLLSEEFHIVRTNRAYSKMVGKDRDSLIGNECNLFSASELSPYTQFSSSEWEFSWGDTHFRVFMDKITEPLGKGNIVLRFHDCTEERKLREKLLAKEQVADLGILIGSVAHEINNPTAGILLYAQMLMADLPKDHFLYQDILNIEEAAQRCKRIVQTMLNLIRRSDSRKSAIVIEDCLSDVLALIMPEIKRHKIQLSIDVTGNRQAVVLANKNQFLQVLFHLLQQILQAMPVVMPAAKPGAKPATMPATMLYEKKFRNKIEIEIACIDKVEIYFRDNSKIIPQLSESSVTYNLVKILVEEEGGRLSHFREAEMNVQKIVFPCLR